MNELIAGIDLCDEYTQVSCGDEEKAWTFPTVIFRHRAAGTWSVGEDAYAQTLRGEGSLTDKLVKLVLKDGTATLDGVRYTVPCTVHPEQMEDTQIVRFRVGNVYKNCYIGVYFDDERVMHRKRPVMAPGEMEEIKLEKDKLLLHPELKTITIKVEEA